MVCFVTIIPGSTNYKTSNAVDHAKSDPHKEAIGCYHDDLKKRTS